jgi:hypothetical protein
MLSKDVKMKDVKMKRKSKKRLLQVQGKISKNFRKLTTMI